LRSLRIHIIKELIKTIPISNKFYLTEITINFLNKKSILKNISNKKFIKSVQRKINQKRGSKMDKEKIEVGKIYNLPKRICVKKDRFENISEAGKCIEKNNKGCWFLFKEGTSEESKFFVKNKDIIYVEKWKTDVNL